HDQCNMAVKTSPTPPLIMIEPQFSFGVLIESLNYPAYMSNFNQLLQAESIQFPGKIIFTILQASGLRDGAFNQEPTSDGQMCTTMPAAKHFYPGKLLDQRPLCAHPPCNSLPSFGRQSLRDFSGAQSRNAIFEGRSLSWLTSSTIRRRRWIPLILVNQFGIAKLNNRTCRRNMWNSQSNQTIEQRRMIPITGVDHHYPKGNLRPEGPIDQVQANLTFGLKQNRFRHVGFLSPRLVFGPTLGQVQASRHRPVKNPIDIMSSYKDLAIINPAKCSAVLPGNSYGGSALLSKAGVINDQYSVANACVGAHLLDTELVHLPGVPFGTSQKFLQSLPIGTWQRSAQFRGRLSACARQKPGSVSFQSIPALRSAQELTKRSQELSKINQWL